MVRVLIFPFLVVSLVLGGAQFASRGASADTASGLVAHWLFDDGADPTADSVGGHDGTLNGAVYVVGDLGLSDTAPVFGNADALDFGGAGEFVEVPDQPTLDLSGSLSVTAWVNLDGVAANGSFAVMKEDALFASKSNYTLGVRANSKPVFALTFADFPNAGTSFPHTNVLGTGECNFNACFSSGVTDFISASSPAGTWRHLAGVYDASTKTIRIYLDGVKDGETIYDPDGTQGLSGTVRTNSDSVLMGKRATSVFGTGYVDGRIDDVRIYNRALTGTEVFALAQSRIEVPIDILPGDETNTFITKPTKPDTVPVAILGTPDFDPTDPVLGVDETSIWLVGAETKIRARYDALSPCDGATDVNSDGILDLNCVLERRSMKKQGESICTLEARTFEGFPVGGEDFCVTKKN